MFVRLRKVSAIAGFAIAAWWVPTLATAADIPARMVTKAPPIAVGYNWTGFYVGGFASYVDGSLEADPAHFATTGKFEDDGWAVGLMGGYRYQFANRVVVGAQIGAPIWTDKGTAEDLVFFPLPAFNPPVRYEAKINYVILGTLQLGYAFDRWLPFVVGGVGVADVTGTTYNVNAANAYSPGAKQESSASHLLWTIGFGVDYAVLNNLIAGVRYTYVDVAREGHNVPWNAPPPNDFGLDGHALHFTLAYRFCGGWWGIC
jgi:opacity protein-like surface antigen